MNCRLCDSACSIELFSDDFRSYFHCEKCGLIFVPARDHVCGDEEKSRYDLHDNSACHEGYVRFLNEIVTIIEAQCSPSDHLLDYGSGKNSVLSRILKERGYGCTAYDPLYGIGAGALAKSYDAIILNEVIEHVRDLRNEALLIKKAAGNTGTIIIRTRRYPSLDTFSGWWYKNDITHINFFSRQTLTHFAAMVGRENVLPCGENIFLLPVGREASNRRPAVTGL